MVIEQLRKWRDSMLKSLSGGIQGAHLQLGHRPPAFLGTVDVGYLHTAEVMGRERSVTMQQIPLHGLATVDCGLFESRRAGMALHL